MRKVLVLQGPNLNLLGRREPEVYGRATLPQIHAAMEREAKELSLALTFVQSNHEGELVDAVQRAMTDGTEALVVNPAAYTHTSVALADALAAAALPYFEVHLSNIHGREAFRRRSLTAPGAAGVIAGCGPRGYLLALRGIASLLGGDDLNS